MSNDVLVFVEQRGGSIKKSSFEALTLGRDLASALGGDPLAVIVGSSIGGLAPEAGKYGASKVFLVDGGALGNYSGDGYCQALNRVFEKAENPALVLFSHTAMGKDLAPRLAAALEGGLVTDATKVEVEGGAVRATKPVFAGKAYRTVLSKGFPFLVTLRPNALSPSEKAGPGEVVEVEAPGGGFLSLVKEVLAASGDRVPLQEAGVIVAGGRGLKDQESFKLVEGLAEAFGPGVAAVGASRAVVDAGWRPHSEQVGQTGKVVSPTLYIALGISGAIQHLAGMSTSKYIVAVNKDPEAPIFKIANYGIVGDIFEVAPRMIEAIKEAVQQG